MEPFDAAPVDWLTENELVEAVQAHLAATGWIILRTSRTTQHGIDVLAEKDGRTLAVEVKGGGSSKSGTARFGMPFTPNQKRSHVAMAVLTALRVLSQRHHEAAIAVPDDPVHVHLIEGIRPALSALGVHVYFVAGDRSVRVLELRNPNA